MVGARPRQGQGSSSRSPAPQGRRSPSSSSDDDVNKAVGAYLQSVLNQLGYKATLKPLSGNIQFTYIQNTKNNVQIALSPVVPGLPRRLGLPQRAARLRLVPPGKRLEHQHRRLLRQGGRRADAGGAEPRRTDNRAANASGRRSTRRSWTKSPLAPLFTPKNIDFSRTGRQLPVPQAVLLAGRAVWVQWPARRSAPDVARAGGGPAAGRAVAAGRAAPWALAGAGSCATGRRWRSVVVFALIVVACLAAPLYADHIAAHRPVQLERLGDDGRRRQAVPVMQPGGRASARRDADRPDLGPRPLLPRRRQRRGAT